MLAGKLRVNTRMTLIACHHCKMNHIRIRTCIVGTFRMAIWFGEELAPIVLGTATVQDGQSDVDTSR